MPASPLTAIILAAGQNSWTEPLSQDPRVLLRINGQTLLERHLISLENAGITDVVVVTGFRRRRIEDNVGDRFPGLSVRYAVNEDYLNQGNGFSLWLGLQQTSAGVLVFDGDVVYAEDILQRFISTGRASAILVGPGRVDDIECTKTLMDENGRVVKTVAQRALTKEELEEFQYVGESTGIFQFSPHTKHALLRLADEFFAEPANSSLNWEHLLNQLFSRHFVASHFDASTQWIGIDTLEDYKAAIELFADDAPLSKRVHD